MRALRLVRPDRGCCRSSWPVAVGGGQQQQHRGVDCGLKWSLGRTSAPCGASAAGSVTLLSSTDVGLPRPGPHLLHGRLHGPLRDPSGRCTAFKPGEAKSDARSRRGASADLQGREDGHRQAAQRGSAFSPPGKPRGDFQGRQVRLRGGPSPPTWPTSTGRTLRTSSACPRSPGSFKPISGIQTPDNHTLRDPPEPAEAEWGRRSGSRHADHRPGCRRSTPRSSTRRTLRPTTPTWCSPGPYMVKNDAAGNLVGYHASTSIQLVRNPNWDRKDRLQAGVPRLDSDAHRTPATLDVAATPDAPGLAPDDRGSARPANVLKLAVTKYKGQYVTIPSGGFRWLPLNTTIKPFDQRQRPARPVLAVFNRDGRAPRAARWAVRGRHRHALHPAGNRRLRPSPAAPRAPGYDYLRNPRRGPRPLATQYMKKAGYPSGKYTGNGSFTMVTENVNPGKAQALVAQAPVRQARLQGPGAHGVSQATIVHGGSARCRARSCSAAATRPGSRTSTTRQSMLEPTFKGSAIQPSGGNNNLAPAERSEDRCGHDESRPRCAATPA